MITILIRIRMSRDDLREPFFTCTFLLAILCMWHIRWLDYHMHRYKSFRLQHCWLGAMNVAIAKRNKMINISVQLNLFETKNSHRSFFPFLCSFWFFVCATNNHIFQSIDCVHCALLQRLDSISHLFPPLAQSFVDWFSHLLSVSFHIDATAELHCF